MAQEIEPTFRCGRDQTGPVSEMTDSDVISAVTLQSLVEESAWLSTVGVLLILDRLQTGDLSITQEHTREASQRFKELGDAQRRPPVRRDAAGRPPRRIVFAPSCRRRSTSEGFTTRRLTSMRHRKPRDRPLDGSLIVDKPPGLTSTDVVSRARNAGAGIAAGTNQVIA
jgi:hypothetical protein